MKWLKSINETQQTKKKKSQNQRTQDKSGLLRGYPGHVLNVLPVLPGLDAVLGRLGEEVPVGGAPGVVVVAGHGEVDVEHGCPGEHADVGLELGVAELVEATAVLETLDQAPAALDAAAELLRVDARRVLGAVHVDRHGPVGEGRAGLCDYF